MLVAGIGVSNARHSALEAASQPVPPVVQVRGLVDTGASCTCVDPSVLKALLLTPTGKATVSTPTTGATPETKDQYDIGLLVPGRLATHTPLVIPSLPVVCADLLQAQGFHALIGRDVLASCLLTYDGVSGLFTLAY